MPLQSIDPEDSDIMFEVPVDPESNALLPSLGPQVSSSISPLLYQTSSTTMGSSQPTEQADKIPLEVPKLPKIDLSWMKDKQKEMWNWLKWKSDELKDWWAEKVPGKNC